MKAILLIKAVDRCHERFAAGRDIADEYAVG
jgi:hypothetical protein